MGDRSSPRITPAARRIDASRVPFLVARLFSATRKVPAVAVTTSATTGEPHLDPDALAADVGEAAEVYLIPTGEATWALSAALPEKLDVYGGAVRIWWPGLTRETSPYDHPLLFARSREDGEQGRRRVLAAIRPTPPPAPAPWKRVAEAYQVGDVVWGVVENLKPFGAFVELLPGVVGLVHKSELDWTFVDDPADFVSAGEQVRVQILRLDPVEKQADLSVKRAWNREPRAPLPAEPGGRPLLSDAPPPRPVPVPSVATAALDELQAELESVREDRLNLLRRMRELQKELRSAGDRVAYLERTANVDATASETAFLVGVRIAYARQFGEDERRRYPLARMRVGAAFLDRLRNLAGIGTEKVLEVCAQVAAGRAHEIPAREVHRLRQGEGGTGYANRKRDGAAAWRCSLQDATPGARRLHWWNVPGPDGATIEFASVGVHDDYGIPD